HKHELLFCPRGRAVPGKSAPHRRSSTRQSSQHPSQQRQGQPTRRPGARASPAPPQDQNHAESSQQAPGGKRVKAKDVTPAPRLFAAIKSGNVKLPGRIQAAIALKYNSLRIEQQRSEVRGQKSEVERRGQSLYCSRCISP